MTAQAHEGLILDGVETSMACLPAIPNHPRILKHSQWVYSYEHLTYFGVGKDKNCCVGKGEIDKLLSYALANGSSTACNRNYVGNWEIKDGRLYLIGIVGIYELIGDEPLFADWYSGKIRIPLGNITEYVHLGFLSSYERELLIKIRNGAVIRRYERTFCLSNFLKRRLWGLIRYCHL